ncbi:response regulator transcription factor [bacterium]|nr:response regulator transcription factor [bacterium]
MNARLCFVEDDPTIADLVSEKLRSRGFEVCLYDSAEHARENLLGHDVYVFDWMLPGASGLELCAQLREQQPKAPILILSALGDPSHRVEGLRAGADDYLTKPFEMDELLLRLDGMLRRRSWYGEAPASGVEFRWEGGWVDFEQLLGESRGERFRLTQKEAMLFKLFVERSGEIVTRDEILDRVWGYHLFPSTRTVDNFIVRLRKYFEKEPGKPRYFHSVRGMGYRFTP